MNRARRFWLNLHLWVGLIAGLLLVIVGLSGSALVWHGGLDAVLNPERQVASASEPALPLAAYLERAAGALEPGTAATTVRLPSEPNEAVRVNASTPAEGRPRSFTVWLDPGDGSVLDVADNRGSLIGILHVLHGSLMIPQWSGRQIVGWLGVVMTASVLSGIWLWWPRVGSLRKALWWRPGRKPSANLHHVFGAWIALPLLIVSLTGVYISFPQTARALLGPPQLTGSSPARPPFGAKPLANPALAPDDVVERALATEPGARLASLAVPTEMRPAWHVQASATDGRMISIEIDDRTGEATLAQEVPSGSNDPLARLMRRLHDGQDMGIVWQAIVFLTGVLPVVFWVTGIMMWLRRRRPRRTSRALQTKALLPSATSTEASGTSQVHQRKKIDQRAGCPL